jgi:hypothetical protein
MHVCALLGSIGKRLREKNAKENKSLSCYISRLPGGVLIHPVATEVNDFVKVTNKINQVNFGDCMLKGLVSATGRFWSFPLGS